MSLVLKSKSTEDNTFSEAGDLISHFNSLKTFKIVMGQKNWKQGFWLLDLGLQEFL